MKTLIVYGSKHGTAKRCAEILSDRLKGEVEIYNVKDGKIPAAGQFDNIIVGGSIYAGLIQKEIKEYCQKNIEIIKQKRAGLFICCMVKDAVENQIAAAFPQELLNAAVAKESFGGEFKFKEMNFFEKAITKMVGKSLAKNDPVLAKADLKSNISMISEENINRFALQMNGEAV